MCLNPFQQWLYDFEIHLFTPRTTEGLICNYYRRFKHSLMLQKEKLCIESRGVKTFEQNGDVYNCLILPKYHIYSFSTAIQRLHKIVTCFPEDKISYIYPDLQILNAWFFLLEHQWTFELSVIIINLLHLYSAFLGTQSSLHSMGGISSSNTNVQHPPGWCNGSHIAPERPPHTPAYWWRGDRVMKPISVYGDD